MKKAADCHREVSEKLKKYLKPNLKYMEICTFVESEIKKHFGKDDITQGSGFPVGLSVNNIIVHDSAFVNDIRTIKKDDVIKIDFGTHCNGMIIDCAYTHIFNKKYENLVLASKEATMKTIKNSGCDVIINELSKGIQEVIESYEITLDNKTFAIKAVSDLGGHNILPYKIHGGKIILSKPPNPEYMKNIRMEENEFYAIETFASTGNGYLEIVQNLPVTHYMVTEFEINKIPILKSSEKMLKYIKNNKKTLPFSQRWLNNYDEKFSVNLNNLVKRKIVTEYPPLMDKESTFTSQHEHTIYISDKKVDIMSL